MVDTIVAASVVIAVVNPQCSCMRVTVVSSVCLFVRSILVPWAIEILAAFEAIAFGYSYLAGSHFGHALS